MTKFFHLIRVIVLSAASAFAVTHYAGPVSQTAQVKETAYQRVMRTGTLRCGYILAPTLLEKNVTTGTLSGLSYDVTEAMARALGIKTQWVEEVGYDGMFEGLKNGRYDMLCTPISPTPSRARAALFSRDFLYAPYYAYVRFDDTRFDNNLKAINDPAIKFAVLEGELSLTVKNEDFPKAAILSLASPADVSLVLLQVSSGKADVALATPALASPFMQNNPGKVRPVQGLPVRMISASYAMAVGEDALKSLVDTTLNAMDATGATERLTVAKPDVRDFYMLPAQPWRRAGE